MRRRRLDPAGGTHTIEETPPTGREQLLDTNTRDGPPTGLAPATHTGEGPPPTGAQVILALQDGRDLRGARSVQVPQAPTGNQLAHTGNQLAPAGLGKARTTAHVVPDRACAAILPHKTSTSLHDKSSDT